MNIKEAIEHCWDRKDYPEVFRDDAGLDISIPGFITGVLGLEIILQELSH